MSVNGCINSNLNCVESFAVVMVACSTLHHDSVMDSTTKTENLVVNQKFLAQLENLVYSNTIYLSNDRKDL